MISSLKRLLPDSYAAGDALDFGDYVLRLKVNQRARRISLRIDNRTGEAVVTAPRAKHLKDAVDFARTRHDWILEHRRETSVPMPFAPGMVLSLRGHDVTLVHQAGVITPRAVQQPDGSWQLQTSGDEATFARRIHRYLKQQAMKTVQAETDAYAARLGFSGVKVSLFDARGRWGSCTPARKAIRYSWRVILAPRSVLSYLCAHEVAHLKHPDHSPRFWAEVTALYGDYKTARTWLKTQGHELFRYQ